MNDAELSVVVTFGTALVVAVVVPDVLATSGSPLVTVLAFAAAPSAPSPSAAP